MLTLHRAERTDVLADALAEVLRTPLPDPMTTEIVAVPARGVERWLSQRLAGRLGVSGQTGAGQIRAGQTGGGQISGDGIAANIEFCSPAALTDLVVAASARQSPHAAIEGGPGLWHADGLVWPVLAVLDDLVDDPQMRMLARHIGASPETADQDGRRGRRYATARHIADLFEGYARRRPAMLVDWATGGAGAGGAGGSLPDDMSWQPRFFREVRARIGGIHPVEQLDELCQAVRENPDGVDLPERLSVFGPTRISETFRRVAAALSAHRDVHLFVPHPGPALWKAIADTGRPTDSRRSNWVPPALANPLLAGLSHEVQELQLTLAPVVDADIHHRAPETLARTVLQAVTAGIRDDTDPRAARGTAAADNSIEIHACHGPERQVEALRDRLLHLFSADPTLQPRDVIIMCPDVETFAPLIRGAFGQSGLDHPAAALRVRLADRGLRHLNPVLDVVATVVELGVGRVTAGEVVDLLALDPVRRRFEMSDDDLDWVREWLSRSGIRWGIDNTQRARFQLSGFAQGTFAAGLDRIVLGVLAEEDDGQWLGTALPLEGVESTQIDLVGRLVEFVERLGATLARLAESAPATDWAATLLAIIDDLTAADPGDEWQQAQAARLITEALAPAGDRTVGDDRTGDVIDGQVLRLSDIRDVVAMMIAGRPSRANFRTGELTVCTLVPMRSVPHRVVVLLGIDTDAFPRALRVDGDDVLGRVPLLGERNPRAEDRQLFLDALRATQENLLVFYTGADPVSGARVPPAVVVSELADTVATLRGVDPSEVICRHTLHGFDERNFTDAAFPGVDGPFSFDHGLLDGARALREPTQPVPRIAQTRLTKTADDEGEVELASLVTFFANPIEGFVRQRLGARIPDDDRGDTDRLDVSVGGLDEWAIGDRLLTRTLAGADLLECQMAELRRGTLPPAEFGRRELTRISRAVGAVYDVAAGLRHGERTTRDFVLDLPDGTRLHGSVGNVFGTGVVEATYSKVRAKQRLAAWIRLVAVAAAHRCGVVAGPVVDSITVVGRADRKAPGVTAVRLSAPDDPLATLADLVAIRRLGLSQALPLPLDPGAVYATKCSGGSSESIALTAAASTFDGLFGANTNPYVRFVYGDDVTSAISFEELTGLQVPNDPRWTRLGIASGTTMFTGLARKIWDPIVAHEVIR